MVAPALLSSATDEWSTPQELFDTIAEAVHPTLDVCATAENHKCEKYFTREQDGLKQDWGGEIIWCNPPYGKNIGAWVERCAKHKGLAVMLLPARTDTRWWQDHINDNPNAIVRFIRGRLKFGGAKNPAPFPSAIVIFLNITKAEK